MIMSTDMRNTMIGQIANQMNEIVQALPGYEKAFS
jgi:hypothetical protein